LATPPPAPKSGLDVAAPPETPKDPPVAPVLAVGPPPNILAEVVVAEGFAKRPVPLEAGWPAELGAVRGLVVVGAEVTLVAPPNPKAPPKGAGGLLGAGFTAGFAAVFVVKRLAPVAGPEDPPPKKGALPWGLGMFCPVVPSKFPPLLTGGLNKLPPTAGCAGALTGAALPAGWAGFVFVKRPVELGCDDVDPTLANRLAPPDPTLPAPNRLLDGAGAAPPVGWPAPPNKLFVPALLPKFIFTL